MREYTEEQLAAQPIGYWSGALHKIVTSSLRAALAEGELTQPHWWTLNHVSDKAWTRSELAEMLFPYADEGVDFEVVFDDLLERGWLAEDEGVLRLTPAGEAGLEEARRRNRKVHEQTHAGIEAHEYAAALNMFRRMISNLGGDSELP